VEPPAAGTLVRARDEPAVQARGAKCGRCWDRDKTPLQLEERLLLGALDVESAGMREVLAELHVAPLPLRQSVAAALRIAS
jgi:hypothetical protein